MSATTITIKLPEVIKDLWTAQQALTKHYAATGLKFTLDGRLVGDIAEALALDHFDLQLPPKRTGGVDALTRSGKTVQVKATGNPKSGPAFTPGKGRAEYLLFFAIDFQANTASVIYNGPEAPVRALLPTEGWSSTKVLPLLEMVKLAKNVAPSEMIAYTARLVAVAA
jgi:hypothetical protein